MGDHLVLKSATVVPMFTSQWNHATHNLKEDSSSEVEPDDFLFRWDGQLEQNQPLVGDWKLVTGVETIDAFDPEEKNGNAHRPFKTSIHFMEDGSTDDPLFIWSGNKLMNLDRYEAHQLELKTIGEAQYFFVERGDFRGRHRFGGRDAYLVYSR